MNSFKYQSVILTRQLLQYLYCDPVKNIAELLGLKPSLRAIYDKIDATTSENASLEVGNTTAVFHADTVIEKVGYDKYQVAERQVMEDLLTNLKDGDVFYDIGAWLGSYSCLVGQHETRVDIVPFEPLPDRVRRFEENMQLNGLDIPLHQVALSNEPETANVHDSKGELEKLDSPTNSTEIEFVDGDEYITQNRIPQATVMKIDVEGAELSVLDGLETALSDTRCRLIYIEVHTAKLPAGRQKVTQILKSHGFKVTQIHQRDSEIFLRGTTV